MRQCGCLSYKMKRMICVTFEYHFHMMCLPSDITEKSNKISVCDARLVSTPAVCVCVGGGGGLWVLCFCNINLSSAYRTSDFNRATFRIFGDFPLIQTAWGMDQSLVLTDCELYRRGQWTSEQIFGILMELTGVRKHGGLVAFWFFIVH